MTDPIQAEINAIGNAVVRNLAQAIYTRAMLAGDIYIPTMLHNALNMSARGDGFAIFYSGIGENGKRNEKNAKNLQIGGLPVYLFSDTALGRYIDRSSVGATAEVTNCSSNGFGVPDSNFRALRDNDNVYWLPLISSRAENAPRQMAGSPENTARRSYRCHSNGTT